MVAFSIVIPAYLVHSALGLVRFDADRDRSRVVDRFSSFISKYGRAYEKGSDEYEKRLSLFAARLQHIEKVNSQPGKLWTAGVNPLADRTDEERSQLLGWRGGASQRGTPLGMHSPMAFTRVASKRELPEHHDWMHLWNMNQIRDQGSCGSCWAITTTTVLAAHSEIYRDNRTFSTQELVECVPNPRKCGGEGGCEGATVELAMQYVATRGVRTPREHPYKASDLWGCDKPLLEAEVRSISTFTDEAAFHESGAKGYEFGMRGWEKLAENRYEPLLRAVFEEGPVAVSIAANDKFMFYSDGIFDRESCDFVLNHAVTLVGYGKSDGNGYWLIQNSWGPEWGEHGKIRVQRGEDEESYCGDDNQPEMGTGCEGGPSSVRVCGTCGLLYDSVVPIFQKSS